MAVPSQTALQPALPAADAAPSEGSLPPVRVTEEDRVAWMRQFLNALEQWKSFLDSLLPATEAPAARPPAAAERPAEVPLPGAGGPPGGGGDPTATYAVYAATAQAQQAQYLQQYQFWQQMRVHEAQRMGKGGQVLVPPQPMPTRFKDNFRPMRLCKHLTTMGFCRQGDQCTFAHTYEELHLSSADLPKPADESALAGLLAEQAGAVAGAGGADTGGLPDLRLKKKKELCGRFARGYCSLGKVCSFAHGEDELNTVGLAVCGKVKTQLCRNWEAGRCVYGANCNNAHGEQEIGTRRPPPELAPPSKRRRDEEGWTGAGEDQRGDEQQLLGEAPQEQASVAVLT